MNLDFMPSPSPEHPGLFIRDPYKFSDAMLIIPPLLVEALRCFDGAQTDLDLRQVLVRLTNDLQVGETESHLIRTLSGAGFLEDETFETMRADRKRDFAAKNVREPAHAGAAYPGEPAELRETLSRYMAGDSADAAAVRNGNLFAIAAPHVSPEGGWQSYRAAYRMLKAEHGERTFVILATSHYGEPERFGLTRKSFRTPLGEAVTDQTLVDWLAARTWGSAAYRLTRRPVFPIWRGPRRVAAPEDVIDGRENGGVGAGRKGLFQGTRVSMGSVRGAVDVYRRIELPGKPNGESPLGLAR